LYTDRNCSVGEYGCRTTTVDIIPANEPLAAGPYVMPPFSLTFNGVDPTAVSANNTQVAATTICQIINEYWGFGAYYKCDVGVRDFQCTGNTVPSSSGSSTATTIEFKTVASVYKRDRVQPVLQSSLAQPRRRF
jgi:hypothetical protein